MFKDVARGKLASRARWDACPSVLKAGDTLAAVKLDMFGRSVSNLQEVAQDFAARNISRMCLDQPIDTTSAQGKLFFTILATFAEFERDLISGRTRDGLAATKARAATAGARAPKPHDVAYARGLGVLGAGIVQVLAQDPDGAAPVMAVKCALISACDSK